MYCSIVCVPAISLCFSVLILRPDNPSWNLQLTSSVSMASYKILLYFCFVLVWIGEQGRVFSCYDSPPTFESMLGSDFEVLLSAWGVRVLKPYLAMLRDLQGCARQENMCSWNGTRVSCMCLTILYHIFSSQCFFSYL